MRKLGGLTVLVGLLGAWAASAQAIYGTAYSHPGGLETTLYSISPTTGAATPIGAVGFPQVGSLAFAPNGTLYGIANSNSGERGAAQLLTIDTTTGAGTLVGAIHTVDMIVTNNFNDLAFRSDGVLFGYASNADEAALYTINTTTGQATKVGNTGIESIGNALAFSSANVLYTANDKELDTLDQSTGARTRVVALDYSQFGTTVSRANGMKFDPSTGKLYASVATAGASGQQASSLGFIDISTGVVTRIGPTVNGLDAIEVRPAANPTFSTCSVFPFIGVLAQPFPLNFALILQNYLNDPMTFTVVAFIGGTQRRARDVQVDVDGFRGLSPSDIPILPGELADVYVCWPAGAPGALVPPSALMFLIIGDSYVLETSVINFLLP